MHLLFEHPKALSGRLIYRLNWRLTPVPYMSIKLSARVQSVKPSLTLAITTRAAEMRTAGKDVIGLGAGEPDFDTPNHIKAAAIKAIEEGFTKYTPVDGTVSLKQAVINKFRRDNGFEYKPEQILISCGGKQSFYNLAQAILDPGDEVIIPAPYWVSYPDMTLLAGGVPVCRGRDGSAAGVRAGRRLVVELRRVHLMGVEGDEVGEGEAAGFT